MKSAVEWQRMTAVENYWSLSDTMEGLYQVRYSMLRLSLQRVGNKPMNMKNLFPMKKEPLLKTKVDAFLHNIIIRASDIANNGG